jgi:radical SAM superfamily enzyme YgiQ (UPF0313 family)
MKILLINPNRYRTPPVPPIGLEYLQSTLRNTRHESRILDLCFAEDPVAELAEELDRFEPQAAGLTIRNIDSVIYLNNIFFLDEIKELVNLLKERGIPVILGGVGFSFNPHGILDYLGAGWGISGPGEFALARLLDTFEQNPPVEGTVLDGWESSLDPELSINNRGDEVDYRNYLKEGGIVGFQTQKGCFQKCSYCLEGNGRVHFRNPLKVVEELASLVSQGFNEFHLCDTEFNQDLNYCHNFLETLIAEGPSISWVLYMKSAPYDEKLFRLLKKSGAGLVTLSLPTGKDPMAHASEIRKLSKKHGIKLAVDFLCGFPGQSLDTIKDSLESLRRIRPDTVGLISVIRLFEGMEITRSVTSSTEYQKNLCGETENNPSFIRPVFYKSISPECLHEIIGEDPLFKIEGFERTSNYERLKE